MASSQSAMGPGERNMPDTHVAALGRPDGTGTNGPSTTPEFDTALVDAGKLLEHAASSGLLSADQPDAVQVLIRDVVAAQEAARSGQLTSEIVIAFWIAYGRLAHLVEPVTAAS